MVTDKVISGSPNVDLKGQPAFHVLNTACCCIPEEDSVLPLGTQAYPNQIPQQCGLTFSSLCSYIPLQVAV